APPDTIVCQQLGSGFIDQMSVLNALDTGGDRLSDRTRHIRVYGDIGAPIVGGLNRGTNLRFGVLGRFNRIIGRSDAAACHQLDLARTVPQLLSRSQADFIGAVSDGSDAFEFGVAQRSAQRPRNLKEKPKVSMAGGL